MRAVLIILIILLFTLQIRLWWGEGGIVENRRLEQSVIDQREENARLRERNAALEAEVEDLKNAREGVEERARGELGMVRDGEVFYQVVEPATPEKEIP